MKASKNRSEQFISGAVHSATPTSVLSSSSPLYNPIERPHSAQPYTKKLYKSDLLSLNMDEEKSSIGMPSQQSMQLVQRQDQYLSQRGQAIENIESTIHEGSIFQQLAQMVSEHAETVQRYIPRGWPIRHGHPGRSGPEITFQSIVIVVESGGTGGRINAAGIFHSQKYEFLHTLTNSGTIYLKISREHFMILFLRYMQVGKN
jgi:hypothetical protein